MFILKDYHPDFVVVSLGFDTAKGDPIGRLDLSQDCFSSIAIQLFDLKITLFLVQEGGYNPELNAKCARAFFTSLVAPDSY
ncbi:hypothetical protein HYX14_05810 [Candidatus Woesearchaeota archaeon]|nr:hypothetical protein [Candidatus Woesearchaeota archaeon]